MIDSAPKPLKNWDIIKRTDIFVYDPINNTIVQDKILHIIPTIVTLNEIRNACRLPLVSEIRFITIKPVKDPMGKHA